MKQLHHIWGTSSRHATLRTFHFLKSLTTTWSRTRPRAQANHKGVEKYIFHCFDDECFPEWDFEKLTIASIMRCQSPYIETCSANGHCTASQYSAIPKHRALLTRTNQKFHHKFFCFWMHENCSKLYSSILTFTSLYLILQNFNFLAGRHFFIR